MQSRAKSQKTRWERIWTSYHALCTSITYRSDWQTFLKSSVSVTKVSPIFCQYVGNFVFKELIRLHHPIAELTGSNSIQRLTYEETNALRYAAGYIPWALKKKLLKSTHPLKKDIQLCILDLLDGDEDQNDSQDWLQLIDRGGLTRVNTTTFEMLVAIEYELRKHIHQGWAPNLEHIHFWLVLTGRRAVHQHYYRWSSDNGWKLEAFYTPVLGLKSTKSHWN